MLNLEDDACDWDASGIHRTLCVMAVSMYFSAFLFVLKNVYRIFDMGVPS